MCMLHYNICQTFGSGTAGRLSQCGTSKSKAPARTHILACTSLHGLLLLQHPVGLLLQRGHRADACCDGPGRCSGRPSRLAHKAWPRRPAGRANATSKTSRWPASVEKGRHLRHTGQPRSLLCVLWPARSCRQQARPANLTVIRSQYQEPAVICRSNVMDGGKRCLCGKQHSVWAGEVQCHSQADSEPCICTIRTEALSPAYTKKM